MTRAPFVSPSSEVDDATIRGRVLPTWESAAFGQLSRWTGGPFGWHGAVGRQAFFTPLRVLLFLAVAGLLLGFGSKAPCLEQHETKPGQYEVLWGGHNEYARACYTDIVPLYGSEGFDKGFAPYRDHRPDGHWMEYPVLLGYFQYAAAGAAHAWSAGAAHGALPPLAPALVFFAVCALAIAAAWLVVVWASAKLAGDRVWDVWLVALSPVVFVQAFTNFDGLGVAFLMAALLAWRKNAPLLVGLLAGLGAAVKLFPVLLFFPLLLVAWRDKRLGDWGKALLAAAGALVAVNFPVAYLYRDGWAEFFTFNKDRSAQEGSLIYLVFDYVRVRLQDGAVGLLPPEKANLVSFGAFALLLAGIAAVALTARRAPTLEQLMFLTITAFLLTSKVWSSQYSLWLVPLAVLAFPRVWALLGWMVLELLNWLMREWWFYQGFSGGGDPTVERLYLVLLVLRDGALVAICAALVQSLYRSGGALAQARGAEPELAEGPALVYTGRPNI
ncbi:MAG: glycosyltransferase family 87 protein [Segniliparus sp.]|uniref:glycosyltransferase family 87 protein n=1 Tax=Segniliparus sp. TaxID=2804064 RepID=UPI003F374F09